MCDLGEYNCQHDTNRHIDDFKMTLYICPNHRDIGIHAYHSYLFHEVVSARPGGGGGTRGLLLAGPSLAEVHWMNA